MSIDYNQKSASIIYSCYVDLSKEGSYTEHVFGICEAAKKQNSDFELWSTARSNVKLSNSRNLVDKSWIFCSTESNILNYILFDIIGSLNLIKRRKLKPIFYVRPTLISLFQLLTARAMGLEVVLEINGVASEELKVKGKWYYVLVKVVERIQLRLATRGVCVSEGIRGYYSRITAAKLSVVSNGCRLAEIRSEHRVIAVKDRMELVFIGSLVPWQGLLEFLKALGGYSNLSRLRIHVFGEGALESNIKLISEELGIDLIFYGWIESKEIPNRLEDIDIALLPRLSHGPSGSPLKLFRYMSMGFPIITTNADGIKELEGLDKILLKFDYSEVGSLHNLLDMILLGEIDLNLVSKKTLEITRERFTWDVSYAKIFPKI